MSASAEQTAQIAAAAEQASKQWNLLALERTDAVVEIGSGQVDAVRSGEEFTACLRVHLNGRTGTATTTRSDDGETIVRDAVRSARVGPLSTWHTAVPRSVPTKARFTETVPPQDTTQRHRLRELATELASLQDEFDLTLHAEVRCTEQTLHRAAPGATSTDHDEYVHTSVVAEVGGSAAIQLPWVGWSRTATVPPGLRSWLRAGASWSPSTSALPTGGRLVLAPPAVHSLVTPLVVALSGDSVAAGRSFLANQLGLPLLHPAFTVRDGPQRQQSANGTDGLCWPTSDDDGFPATALTLIENGTPVQLYHSVASAAASGVAPTGHGFRGNALSRNLLRPVSPVLNHATLDVDGPVATTVDELIDEAGDGVLIESLLGSQQRSGLSPIVEGRVRLGFVFRRGRVVGTLPPTAVTLDLRRILGDRFVSVSDQQWAVSRIWSASLPFLLADVDIGDN